MDATLDPSNACFANVRVSGLRKAADVQALLDTGFGGHLGKVNWHGEEMDVYISITPSETALRGTGLLADSELYLNYVTHEARIAKVEEHSSV